MSSAEKTRPCKETKPAACDTDVTCHECGEGVVIITFGAGGDTGVCACSWTSWHRQSGVFFRSTPLGYEPKKDRVE